MHEGNGESMVLRVGFSVVVCSFSVLTQRVYA